MTRLTTGFRGPCRPGQLLLLVLPMLLTGCFNLAPDYHRPSPAVPDTWPTVGDQIQAPTGDTTPARQLAWDQFFLNDKLKHTVKLSLRNNRDLRQAALAIETARAEYHLQGAALFPSINASGNANIEKSPTGSSSSGASSGYGGRPVYGGSRGAIRKSSSIALGFTNYEIDFFGKLRNNKQAAFEQLLSSAATRRSTQISIIAETANDWLTLAADKQRLALAQKTLRSQRDYYQTIRAAKKLGVVAGADVDSARASVASAREAVATYTTTVAQDRNALNLVVGTIVSKHDLPGAGVPRHAVLVKLPAGVPSQVLENRPDVLAAEHTLKADNADIGAARAAFFPTISLTASAGYATQGLTHIVSSNNATWTIAPSISLPILDFGKNWASLDQAKAQKLIAIANYQQTLQTAFEGVANALATRATIGDQISAQQSLVSAQSSAYKRVRAARRIGTGSALDVFQAQQAVYSARQTMISKRLSRATNLITLYKVLGGGSMDVKASN